MPISDCEVRDPRIRRTRQLLQGALLQLLGSKSFDDISVQDITDAATVNRATFPKMRSPNVSKKSTGRRPV
jgi:AcrR family transcriptional regulator